MWHKQYHLFVLFWLLLGIFLMLHVAPLMLKKFLPWTDKKVYNTICFVFAEQLCFMNIKSSYYFFFMLGVKRFLKWAFAITLDYHLARTLYPDGNIGKMYFTFVLRIFNNFGDTLNLKKYNECLIRKQSSERIMISHLNIIFPGLQTLHH